jgi:hypothetical protein
MSPRASGSPAGSAAVVGAQETVVLRALADGGHQEGATEEAPRGRLAQAGGEGIAVDIISAETVRPLIVLTGPFAAYCGEPLIVYGLLA